MFCFKAGLFLDELERYSPEIYNASKTAYENAPKDKVNSDRREGGLGQNLIRIAHNDMAAIPEESIDYAVMEKSSCVRVIPSDIAWSDLGKL